MSKVAVIGAGAWGTALAIAAQRAGQDVLLWARSPQVVTTLTTQRENIFLLPGIRIDEAIEITGDPERIKEASLVLFAVPAQQMRAVTTFFAPYLHPEAVVLICSKGIEQNSFYLMTEVVAETIPSLRRAVMSGPNFAQEVGHNLPAAISVAVDPTSLPSPSEALPLATQLAETLGSLYFRPYASEDAIGVQIAGALKNVIAIACGIVRGRALGENARAAVMTRGLLEIMQLGVKKGAKIETFFGLAGIGDLTLTCCSDHASRNTNLGAALGRGESLESIQNRQKALTEGVYTAVSAVGLAQQLGVDMPLIQAVHRLLSGFSDIDTEILGLLSRPYRSELPKM